MQINITGHHIEVTPALKQYVTSKFDKLERHFDSVLDVHVILTVEKLRHKAEADLRVSGNHIHAESTDGDMYAAIDLLVDKLDRQIVKHKEKMKDKHAHEAQRGRTEA
jgi:putative sigma-54 modulation protein